MLTIPQLLLITLLGLPYAILHRRGSTPSTPRKVQIAKISGLLFSLGGAAFAALDAYWMIASVQTRHVLISKASTATVGVDPDTNPVAYVLLFLVYFGAVFFFSFIARKVWRGERI